MFAAPAPHETRRSCTAASAVGFHNTFLFDYEGILYETRHLTETTPTVKRHGRTAGRGDCGGGELAAEAAVEEASAAEAAVATMRGRGDPHRAAPPAAPVDEPAETAAAAEIAAAEALAA